jgi:hypothetical protein
MAKVVVNTGDSALPRQTSGARKVWRTTSANRKRQRQRISRNHGLGLDIERNDRERSCFRVFVIQVCD